MPSKNANKEMNRNKMLTKMPWNLNDLSWNACQFIINKMSEKAQIYNQNASMKLLEEKTCNEMTVDKMPQRLFQFC